MTTKCVLRAASFWFVAAALWIAVSGCHEKMAVEGKIRMGERGRLPPEGTIPRGSLDSYRFTGVPAKNPMPLTRELLARGQERYQIYCLPCHGFGGDGDGMVVRRGFSPPPTYHQERLRKEPDSHFFEVITNGYGAMYSYADRVPEPDRWAIIAYIRALQLSRNATIADVPPKKREELQWQH
jgi:mono/diheme cytochrome c family protein